MCVPLQFEFRIRLNLMCGESRVPITLSAVRFSSARPVSLGDVSVFSKGKCESCGTEVGEPAHELIKGRYQNKFAPGNGTLAERVEGFT